MFCQICQVQEPERSYFKSKGGKKECSSLAVRHLEFPLTKVFYRFMLTVTFMAHIPNQEGQSAVQKFEG